MLDVCADPTSTRMWQLLYILPRCVLAVRNPVQGQSLALVVRAAWGGGRARLVKLWREATGGREGTEEKGEKQKAEGECKL